MAAPTWPKYVETARFGRSGCSRHPLIGAAKASEFVSAPVLDEGRFVEADPRDTTLGKFDQERPVDIHERFERAQDVKACRSRSAPQQQAERPQQHRAGRDVEGGGLDQLTTGLGVVQTEVGLGPDFGHKVVIVGVEPLGEVQGRHRATFNLCAAGHGEISIEGDRHVGGTEPGWDGAYHHDGIEHVVVEGEVVGGDEIHTRGGHRLPVALTDRQRRGLEFDGAGFASPEALERPLERPALSDSGHAVDGAFSSGPLGKRCRPTSGGRRVGRVDVGVTCPAVARASSRRWKYTSPP